MYMRPPLSPPRNRTHDQTHQKKKFSQSRSTKPNKMNLISPFPDFQLNSLHHSLKYDRVQSRADKSSTGSDHTSKHKHHSVCYLNPISAFQRDSTNKKKRDGVVWWILLVRNQFQNRANTVLRCQPSKPMQIK